LTFYVVLRVRPSPPVENLCQLLKQDCLKAVDTVDAFPAEEAATTSETTDGSIE